MALWGSRKHYLSRNAVFKHFWSGKEIDEADLAHVLEKHPSLIVLRQCIYDFRQIYAGKRQIDSNLGVMASI